MRLFRSALVGEMVWRQTADQPLLQPVMTHFTDAYMRQQVPVS